MGKRSTFERIERDHYPTPLAATEVVMGLLTGRTFAEPCAGDGAIVRALGDAGYECVWASDIHPQGDHIAECCYSNVSPEALASADFVITNPPWRFDFVADLIERAATVWRRPLWLLLSADFAHNRQSAGVLKFCSRIVSVGRVKWIPDSPHTGKDNCAWMLFEPLPVAVTAFYARAA